MAWECWTCPSCGGTLVLNEQSAQDAWCDVCNTHMIANLDDDPQPEAR